MFSREIIVALLMIACSTAQGVEKQSKRLTEPLSSTSSTADLATSSTNAKLFNLGSLFGQNPYYGNGYYRPTYPSTGGSYYPSGYYPQTGNYYPSNTGTYYPSTGGYYPTTSGGYYPTSGYYPQAGSGGYYPGTTTNILGYGSNGGYGGYSGGNGGLRQYSGYWNPDYSGQRNRGYGYYTNTDRYGLPPTSSTGSGGLSYSDRDRDRGYYQNNDRVASGYRGYD